MGTLTVRENFAFSAALRLPSSISQKEKEQKVERLIQELGLERVADSRVSRKRRTTSTDTTRQNQNVLVSKINLFIMKHETAANNRVAVVITRRESTFITSGVGF